MSTETAAVVRGKNSRIDGTTPEAAIWYPFMWQGPANLPSELVIRAKVYVCVCGNPSYVS